MALSGKAGILDDMQYKAQETQLAPQETLLLFTDGLTEALRSAWETGQDLVIAKESGTFITWKSHFPALKLPKSGLAWQCDSYSF